MSVMVSYAMADAAKDRIVCKATGLAGYMSALHWWSSKSTYTQAVVLASNKSKGNKKCLCITIRDRNDPELGLQINITLNFGLSSVFHAPSNQSDSSPAPAPSPSGNVNWLQVEGVPRVPKVRGLDMVCNGNCHWWVPNMLFLQFTPVPIYWK